MASIIEELNNLAEELGKFEYVNHGGCGFVAGYVGMKLLPCKEVSQVRVRGLSYSTFEPDIIKKVRSALPEFSRGDSASWQNNGASGLFNHIVLAFNYGDVDFLFDTTGARAVEDYCNKDMRHLSQEHFTVQEMYEMGLNRNGWNFTFNRSQIPRMSKIIDEHLDLSKFL